MLYENKKQETTEIEAARRRHSLAIDEAVARRRRQLDDLESLWKHVAEKGTEVEDQPDSPRPAGDAGVRLARLATGSVDWKVVLPSDWATLGRFFPPARTNHNRALAISRPIRPKIGPPLKRDS
ncbi:hypothetical protein AAG570_013544 [Ranatra chinensis]|uniref:Uncharacterized protein n=1 Tax=Ranatra chinensis TaxID=642074 RepID=A0ABD0YP56_9HEMI